jgi:hypothetical protein
VKVIENTVAPERKGAMFSIFEQMDALHPQEAHWYLPLIGVDPKCVRWSKRVCLSERDKPAKPPLI